MQDVQNIPNPDVNTPEVGGGDGEFGSHSEVLPDSRGDSGSHNSDVERPAADIPLPPGSQATIPVEEPPEESDKAPVNEGSNQPPRLV